MQEEKIRQKIKEIEEEITKTPYHKGTERHIGRLKAKLASLKNQLFREGGGGGGSGFAVRKQGDATVVLVGMPSVGKSTLLNKLTGAESKVGHYPFTTLDVIPGVLKWKGAHIQIFDVPGLIKGAARGKGGGKEILSVVRAADLLIMVASVKKPQSFKVMEEELEKAGVRINKKEPKVSIEKRVKGGIEVQGNPGLSKKVVEDLCREFRLMNAKVVFGEKVSEEDLIDILLKNRVYVDAFRLLSKADLLNKEGKKKLQKKFPDALLVSSKTGENIKALKNKIFRELELIRVFLKEAPSSPPKEEPLILKKGATIKKAAEQISSALAQNVEGAKIKGASAKFANQKVGLDHKLEDKDEVYFVKEV